MTSETDSENRRFDRLFPWCYALAFASVSFLVHLSYFPIGNTGVETDFYADLAPAARKLWNGELSPESYLFKGPVYPFLLTAVFAMVQDWYRSGVLINVIGSGFTIVLMYALVRRLFDRSVAVWACVLLSVTPIFFVQSHRASTDILFLDLSLLSIYLFLGNGTSNYFRAGLVGGIAFLTRYNGIFLLPAAIACLSFYPAGAGFADRIRAALRYSAGFIVAICPWILFQFFKTGKPLQTRNLENVRLEFYPPRADGTSPEFDTIWQLIAHDPIHFFRRYFANIPEHVRLDFNILFPWIVGVLASVGAIVLLIRGRSRARAAFFVFSLGYLGVMALVFWVPRFSLFLVPTYLTLVVIALTAWKGRFARIATTIAVLLLATSFGKEVIENERVFHDELPLHVLEAADHLAADPDSEGAFLLARKPHLAFYAGMEPRFYPTARMSYSELLAHSAERNIRYLAYGQQEYAEFPWLRFLSLVDSLPYLEPVYHSRELIVHRLDPALDLEEARNLEPYVIAKWGLASAKLDLDLDRYAIATDELATYHMSKGEPSLAIDAIERSLQFLLSQPAEPANDIRVSRLRVNLAVALMNDGRPDRAMDVLESNLALLEGGLDSSSLAQTHFVAGILQEGRRELDLARFHYEAARPIFESNGNRESVSEIDSRLRRLGR